MVIDCRKGITKIIVVLALTLMIINKNHAQTAWVGEQLMSGTLDSWEPFIAADPKSLRVYAVWFNPNGPAPCNGCPQSTIQFISSNDGGLNWTNPVWLASQYTSQSQYDPTIKVVPATGVIYATWMEWNAIMFSKSSDYGSSWTAPIKVSGSQWADHPWFGNSADGKDIYVFWSKGDVYGVASHDYGKTWTASIKVNSDKNRQYYAEGVEVLNDGTVILSACSYPCSKGTSQCKGIININVFRSTNSGKSYSQNVIDQVYTGPQWLSNSLETVAADQSGNLMLLYNGATMLGNDNQLFIRSSSNKGISWSNKKVLSPVSRADACYPAIVAGTSGDFRITYMDNRTGAYNVWFRETKDFGTNWSADLRISDKTSGVPYKSNSGFGAPYGDYTGLSILSNNQTFAIYGESGPQQVSPGGIWMNRSLSVKANVPTVKITQNIAQDNSELTIKAIPNPFTDKVKLIIQNHTINSVKLDIANINGQLIKTVFEGKLLPGVHEFEMPVNKLSSQELVYLLNADGKIKTGKLLSAKSQ